MTATIGVLALQGAFARHVKVLERCGVIAREIRRTDQLDDLDGLVIPGGESTTMIKLLTAFDLVEPLDKLIDGGLPVFGTCAGMILLARDVIDGHPDQLSFDAIDLDVRRNGYGRQINSFEAEIDVSGIDGSSMTAVFIRAPVVTRTGPEVDVLATLDDHPVLCRQDRILVSSFHPELTDDDRLHQLFIKSIDDENYVE